MNNVFAYIENFGYMTIDEYELNPVDMLVFAQLSYINYELENFNNDDYKLLSYYKDNILELTKNTVFIKNNRRLYNVCINSKRYQNLMIGKIDHINSNDTQYCAMVFKLNNYNFVVYRGTDASVAGWKEDFNMAILDAIPGHIRGLDYSRKIISELTDNIYVIGHSKGGNIATYIGINIEEELQDKIIGIYDFDGPGFKDMNVFNSDKYKKIKEKYYRFVPQDDFVGILLNNSYDIKVVKSYAVSVFQHDLFTWCIDGDDFKTISHISFISSLLDESSDLWLNNMDQDKKYEIINIIFKLFEDAGITNFNQFRTNPLKSMKDVLVNYSKDLSSEERKILNKLAIDFTSQGFKVVFDRLKNFFKRK